MSKSTIIFEEFHSKALENNPLGDPVVRTVPVYLPPGYDESNKYPTVYMLAAFAARGHKLLNDDFWQENIQQRLDRLIAEGKVQPLIMVLPDATTRYGGSQYLNSTATGNYEDHILELIKYIDDKYPAIADPEQRAVMGHSSGGYGAFMLSIKHPDIFGMVADHAGDKFFELSHKTDFPHFIRTYDKLGEPGLLQALADPAAALADGFNFFALNIAAMASCYSPNPDAPFGFDLPFDLHTGEIIPDIWQKWLDQDPIHLVEKHIDALKKLKLIFLDCGKYDEHNLLYGARLISKKLSEHNISHIYEEFEGGHRNTKHRYDVSLMAISNTINS